MSIDARYKHLRRMQELYHQAEKRKEKTRLLDAMEETAGLHRRHLIALMGSKIKRKPRKRNTSYGPEVDVLLALIWKAYDSVTFKPALSTSKRTSPRFRGYLQQRTSLRFIPLTHVDRGIQKPTHTPDLTARCCLPRDLPYDLPQVNCLLHVDPHNYPDAHSQTSNAFVGDAQRF